MAYQTIIDTLRGVAEKVNPNGVFVHGLDRDGSLEYPNVEGRGSDAIPYIHVFPFVTNRKATTYLSTIPVLFCEQDDPHSKSTDRESIIARMEILAERFIQRLEAEDDIQVDEEATRMEPEYGFYQAHLSGCMVELQVYHAKPCVSFSDYDEEDYSPDDYQTDDTVQ